MNSPRPAKGRGFFWPFGPLWRAWLRGRVSTASPLHAGTYATDGITLAAQSMSGSRNRRDGTVPVSRKSGWHGLPELQSCVQCWEVIDLVAFGGGATIQTSMPCGAWMVNPGASLSGRSNAAFNPKCKLAAAGEIDVGQLTR